MAVISFSRPEQLLFLPSNTLIVLRGRVYPVPDPVLLRKSGSTGNQTRTSGSEPGTLTARPQRRSHFSFYRVILPFPCTLSYFIIYLIIIQFCSIRDSSRNVCERHYLLSSETAFSWLLASSVAYSGHRIQRLIISPELRITHQTAWRCIPDNSIYPVPGGHKCRNLALQVESLKLETLKILSCVLRDSDPWKTILARA
jgi:hypothetical protein